MLTDKLVWFRENGAVRYVPASSIVSVSSLPNGAKQVQTVTDGETRTYYADDAVEDLILRWQNPGMSPFHAPAES